MYLLILEDGNVFKTHKVSEDDLDSCERGILEIIDISEPEEPRSYFEGEWDDIVALNSRG